VAGAALSVVLLRHSSSFSMADVRALEVMIQGLDSGSRTVRCCTGRALSDAVSSAAFWCLRVAQFGGYGLKAG
jgi:hypothetical protein